MSDTKKVRIILTTNCKSEYSEILIKQLKDNNIPYDDIVYNLPYCSRYMVNDYNDTNNYPSITAININSNSNELSKLLN